ncbi:MAG: ATP synthase F1 subunit epsilon [Phycisphaerae bacterium]
MAKKHDLELVVVTPERQVLSERVDSVVIPAHDGEYGILYNHTPVMCELGVGQLRYAQSGQTRRVFIDGGFAQVNDNIVTVLTTDALLATEITSEAVAKAESAARAATGTSAEATAERDRARRRVRAMTAVASAR